MSNEDIKMSDVFDLPLTDQGCGIDDSLGKQHEGFYSADQDEAAIHAINNHDPMALRIKELEAALNKISELTNNHNVINAKQIADHALGNGKKQ